jgi:hypothetical protein
MTRRFRPASQRFLSSLTARAAPTGGPLSPTVARSGNCATISACLKMHSPTWAQVGVTTLAGLERDSHAPCLTWTPGRIAAALNEPFDTLRPTST